MNEVTLKIKGTWTVQVCGPDGSVKDERIEDNLIVNAGLDWLKDYFLNGSTTYAQAGWIAIGTDATTATATDTLLGAENARQAVTNYTAGGTGVSTVDTTFAAGTGTGTIVEAGLFGVTTSNTAPLFSHVTFAAITKGASDTLKASLTITWTATT